MPMDQNGLRPQSGDVLPGWIVLPGSWLFQAGVSPPGVCVGLPYLAKAVIPLKPIQLVFLEVGYNPCWLVLLPCMSTSVGRPHSVHQSNSLGACGVGLCLVRAKQTT